MTTTRRQPAPRRCRVRCAVPGSPRPGGSATAHRRVARRPGEPATPPRPPRPARSPRPDPEGKSPSTSAPTASSATSPSSGARTANDPAARSISVVCARTATSPSRSWTSPTNTCHHQPTGREPGRTQPPRNPGRFTRGSGRAAACAWNSSLHRSTSTSAVIRRSSPDHRPVGANGTLAPGRRYQRQRHTRPQPRCERVRTAHSHRPSVRGCRSPHRRPGAGPPTRRRWAARVTATGRLRYPVHATGTSTSSCCALRPVCGGATTRTPARSPTPPATRSSARTTSTGAGRTTSRPHGTS